MVAQRHAELVLRRLEPLLKRVERANREVKLGGLVGHRRGEGREWLLQLEAGLRRRRLRRLVQMYPHDGPVDHHEPPDAAGGEHVGHEVLHRYLLLRTAAALPPPAKDYKGRETQPGGRRRKIGKLRRRGPSAAAVATSSATAAAAAAAAAALRPRVHPVRALLCRGALGAGREIAERRWRLWGLGTEQPRRRPETAAEGAPARQRRGAKASPGG
mmetsp:Transcript_20757/g.61338  ORF Transcript_20757/g.61338 Transcript_20757/m.61338 type:complete len:215 (+) Transcript_20757:345-989(+)